MNKPQWHYPTKPFKINQVWGIKNPIYQQFGFSRHNGVDLAPSTDKLFVYPWNGRGKVIRTGNQPQGGGIFLGVLSLEEYDFPDGKRAKILTDGLHAEKLLLKEGDFVETGTPLLIQDNTGFSTGPHTHEQDRRVIGDESSWLILDKNDANGSFDPIPFASGRYAVDIKNISEQLKTISQILAELLKKFAELCG